MSEYHWENTYPKLEEVTLPSFTSLVIIVPTSPGLLKSVREIDTQF